MTSSDRIWTGIAGIVGFALAFFLTHAVFAQGTNYMSADYGRRDCFTHDNLVACWDFNSGLRGDETQTIGDFESWDGAEGGCGACPASWTCACGGTTADVSQETSKLYKNSSSMQLDDGDDSASVYYEFTFAANVNYHIAWWHKGDTGGQEDFTVTIQNAGDTEHYNPATDAWQAGSATQTWTNIASTWARGVLYVKTGGSAKTSYRIYFDTTSANDTIYIDDFQIQQVDAVTSSPGNYTLAPAIAADPDYAKAHKHRSGFSTGPMRFKSADFNGTSDYLEIADDDTFDPSDDYSVGCTGVIPDIVTGSAYIINKFNGTGNQRSWITYRTSAGLVFKIDYTGLGGGDQSSVVKNAVFHAGQAAAFVATYDWGGTSGSATSSIYFDHTAVATDATQFGPIYNSTADLTIGAYDNPGGWFDGTITSCCYWDGVALSAKESAKYISPYYPGNHYGSGTYPTTCTNTASHAVCGWEYCRDAQDTRCEAEYTGVYASFGQLTELVDDSSLETISGGDESPTFSHWTKTETAGSGDSTITVYRDDVFHGIVSARLVTTASDSTASLTSACIDITDTTTYYIGTRVRNLNDFTLSIERYSDNACSTPDTPSSSDIIAAVDVPDSWTYNGATSPAWGTTESIKVVMGTFTAISDGYLDLATVIASSTRVPPVHNSGAGDTTATARSLIVDNILADDIENDNAAAFTDGFCASAWIFTDWSTDGTQRYVFGTPAATDDQFYLLANDGSDYVSWTINHPISGDWRAVYATQTALNWPAGQWKYLEVCTDNAGVIKGHWYEEDGTEHVLSSTSGVGAFTMANMSSEFHVGHLSSANHLDGYIKGWWVVPYNAVYPNEGYNSGNVPQDPY